MAVLIGISIYLILSYLIADKIGRYKAIGFGGSFFVCLIFSPFAGYFFTEMAALKNPRGCNWCGNKHNEALFCGLCGKNENGEIKPGLY